MHFEYAGPLIDIFTWRGKENLVAIATNASPSDKITGRRFDGLTGWCIFLFLPGFALQPRGIWPFTDTDTASMMHENPLN
jgi:hypothetical protein